MSSQAYALLRDVLEDAGKGEVAQLLVDERPANIVKARDILGLDAKVKRTVKVQPASVEVKVASKKKRVSKAVEESE